MYLVDTNILVALMIDSAPKASAARELYARDPHWCTETHAMVELTNVLTRYVRVRELAAEEAVAAIHDAEERFGPQMVSVEHSQALTMAIACGVSAYDARFLVAAQQLSSRLITEDKKLLAAAPELTQSLDEALRR